MNAVILGYSPASRASEHCQNACREFCKRAIELGLAARTLEGGHALATSATPAVRQRSSHHPWRVVHWDGVLHRRATLGMYAVHPDQASDAEVVEQLLCVYDRQALQWLVGDWAVAAVAPDGLLLASDYFGNRALFYHVDDDGGVCWSNHHWLLAEYAGLGDDLDKTYFAGLLQFLPPPDRTPFSGIRAVPAGYAVRLDAHGIRLEPHWLPRRRRVQFPDSREYAEAFFDTLRESVRDRLAVPGRKWIEISGGVDSALIAACINSCRRESGGIGPVEGVHYTTARQESLSDTRRAREVADKHGFRLHVFSHEELVRRSLDACLDDPREPLGAFREITRVAHEQGVVALWSGRLGDLVTGNREPDAGLLIDHAVSDGVRAALASAFAWAVFAEMPVWHLVGRAIANRLFTEHQARLLAIFRDRPGRPADRFADAVKGWTAFVEWPGKRDLSYVDLSWWVAAQSMRLSGSYRSSSDPFACDRTYPFSHRPLLEFVASCPWTEIVGPAEPRRIVHRHLGPLLPRSLAGNILKSDTTTWRFGSLRDSWAAAFGAASPEAAAIVRAGLLDRAELDWLGQSVRTGRTAVLSFGARVLQIELWLRSRRRTLAVTHIEPKGGECHAIRKA